MMATNTVRFFEGLAQRMSHENDLSDIVYALCLCNSGFKQFFVDFFFADEEPKLKAEEVTIEREVTYSGGSRPDFVIRANDTIYFVEVKIWDRNHHFSQYVNTLEELCGGKKEQLDEKSNRACTRLAYITNYKVSQKDLSGDDQKVFSNIVDYDKNRKLCKRIRNWKDFIDCLKVCVNDPNNSWARCEEVQGFIAYCESVCPNREDESIQEFKYSSDDFMITKGFYEKLQDYINGEIEIKGEENSHHTIKLEKLRVDNRPAEQIGFFFSAQDVSNNVDMNNKMLGGEKIWAWVGLRLKLSHNPGFCFAFDNVQGWAKPLFKNFNVKKSWLPICFEPPTPTKEDARNDYYFKDKFTTVFKGLLSTNEFKGLLSTKDIKGDKQIVDAIQKSPYYAVRALSLFLRQEIFPEVEKRLAEGNLHMTLVQPDSFKPEDRCGERFSVVNAKDEKEVGRFWVGVYCDNDNQKGIFIEPVGQVAEEIPDTANNDRINLDKMIEFIVGRVKSIEVPKA